MKSVRASWREERVREKRREARYQARRDYWDAGAETTVRTVPTVSGGWAGTLYYRGSDNRYYCERDNGTTGLIIGGMSGAVLSPSSRLASR